MTLSNVAARTVLDSFSHYLALFSMDVFVFFAEV